MLRTSVKLAKEQISSINAFTGKSVGALIDVDSTSAIDKKFAAGRVATL